MTTTKTLRQELNQARERLNRAIARLHPDDYARPATADGWSIHEILIHIAVWDEVGSQTIDELAAIQSPTRYIVDVDEFNDRAIQREAARGQAPPATLAELERTRFALLRSLDAAPTDLWYERQIAPGGESVSIADLLTTWTAHDDEHAAEIETYLARTGR